MTILQKWITPLALISGLLWMILFYYKFVMLMTMTKMFTLVDSNQTCQNGIHIWTGIYQISTHSSFVGLDKNVKNETLQKKKCKCEKTFVVPSVGDEQELVWRNGKWDFFQPDIPILEFHESIRLIYFITLPFVIIYCFGMILFYLVFDESNKNQQPWVKHLKNFQLVVGCLFALWMSIFIIYYSLDILTRSQIDFVKKTRIMEIQKRKIQVIYLTKLNTPISIEICEKENFTHLYQVNDRMEIVWKKNEWKIEPFRFFPFYDTFEKIEWSLFCTSYLCFILFIITIGIRTRFTFLSPKMSFIRSLVS